MFKKKRRKIECKCKKCKRKCRNFYLMRDPLTCLNDLRKDKSIYRKRY